MADLLAIGLSGLHAAKTNLTVVGHNITNVNTPGYSRQQAIQDTRPAQFTGAGYMGSGTNITEVRRIYSDFITNQLQASTAHHADVKAYKSQIDQLDSLLAGTSTGILPATKSFFSSMQAAAEDPANIPARQLVLAEAEGLARRFNNIYDNISSQNEFINKQLVVNADQVNRLAQTIGSLNDAIVTAGVKGHPPNDLLDKRDEAVRELSSLIGTKVVQQDGNLLNIFIGSGQPLVVGGEVNRIEAVQGRGDPTRYDVNFVIGGSRQNINSTITGGEMGGLLRYREEVLDTTLNTMGRLALSVSDELNRQLGLGLDLKGKVGAALFGDMNDATLTALRVRPMQDNATDIGGHLKIENTQLLTGSDYRFERGLDGIERAFRLSDGQEMQLAPGATAGEYRLQDSEGRDQGFSFKLDGTPANGDEFLLQPTRRGAADIKSVLDQPDQLALAAPLRSEANLQNQGNGKISQPTVEMILDPLGLPMANFVTDKLDQTAIEAVGEITLRYDKASGTLEFATPLPAGVSITTAPEEGATAAPPIALSSLPFIPGQTNALNYAIVVNGQSYTINQSLSGRPENDDTFTVSFNKNGVSDNRNGLALADLQNKQVVGVDANVKSIATGMSFIDDYGKTVERVGTLTAQARQDADATGAILQQAQDNRDALSGVNLDEEAAKLIQFEHYYNASAQVIQVARSMFDTLIGAFR